MSDDSRKEGLDRCPICKKKMKYDCKCDPAERDAEISRRAKDVLDGEIEKFLGVTPVKATTWSLHINEGSSAIIGDKIASGIICEATLHTGHQTHNRQQLAKECFKTTEDVAKWLKTMISEHGKPSGHSLSGASDELKMAVESVL
jgi:hypothetical protein